MIAPWDLPAPWDTITAVWFGVTVLLIVRLLASLRG